MKLTNQQMLDVFAGLNQLSNEKFAAKLAWKIQMARTTLQPLVEALDKLMAEQYPEQFSTLPEDMLLEDDFSLLNQ